MPTSITPPPADDEIECGNCGSYIYAGLIKCPNCGVNLYNPPDIEREKPSNYRPKSTLSLKIELLVRKLRGDKHPAEELFTGAMREAVLFDDLLRKVGGDRSVAERLIEFERKQKPEVHTAHLHRECDPEMGEGKSIRPSIITERRSSLYAGQVSRFWTRTCKQRRS